jgi:16S rRNA (guanine966-N2)-methyltransferase
MSSPRRPPGAVRIIGGRWKRTPLPVVDAEGLRPTPDRVRETVFNWLTHAFESFDGRSALDLFAGSGALGLEAASRGATRVILVERHPKAVARLHETKDRLDAAAVEIVSGDAFAVGRRLTARAERFDVVFVDPPFADGLLAPAFTVAAAVAAPDGFMYVECATPLSEAPALAEAWEVHRADKAGDVFYHLLQRKKQFDEETSCWLPSIRARSTR